MVFFNEILQGPLNRINCTHVVHCAPKLTCFESLLWSLYRNHISSAKYYVPVLVGPVLFKFRFINRDILLKIFGNYLQTTSFAASINAFGFYFVCLSRNLCGRFIWIMTPFLPTWIGAQLCWWLPKRVLNYYITGMSISVLETHLRSSNNRLMQQLVNSRILQTLSFMVCSAIILNYKYLADYKGFWFIKPISKITTSAKFMLPFIFNGIRNYCFLGMTLDLLNVLLKEKTTISLKNFRHTFRIKITKNRFKSTIFFATYIGIYRLSCCLMAMLGTTLSMSTVNVIGAFMSGSAYIFLDDISFVCLATVISIQVLWQHLCNSKRIQKLEQIPLAKILLPLEIAYLVHNFFYNHHDTNGLAKSLVNATSSYNTQRIYNFLTETDKETLLLLLKEK